MQILLDNYVISKQLGAGSFGEVYLAHNKSGRDVALKIEDKKKPQKINNEYKIYKYLHKSGFNIGLPKIYEFIQTVDYNIMAMQLLGPSLEDIFNTTNRLFDLQTVFHITEQLIKLMKSLHETGYIHRDIKPNNFLFDAKTQQIYMMDFGLSKQYLISGKHMDFKNGRSLIGTARYASINMHMGFEPSRRDDLESVGYMLVYFLKGSLPWQGIKKQKDVSHIKLIGDKKMCTSLESLCTTLPQCFKRYISYCRKLKFTETPDYDFILRLFSQDCRSLKIKPRFNWKVHEK